LGYQAQRLGIHAPIFELEPPGRAVDHYLNIDVFTEDLDRAKFLGMNAYRFSLEWGRIQPVRKDWVNNKPNWINESQKARDKAQEYQNEAKRLQNVGAADQAMEYQLRASTELEKVLSIENAPPDANDFDGNAMKTYLNMVKKMVEKKLTPIVTLNHMTLPLWVLTPPEAHDLLGFAIPDAGFKDSLRGWEEEITVKAFEKFINMNGMLIKSYHVVSGIACRSLV
jgi:beta-glucosidase/6-phospho-beta-glucosidase/beta-galactosidase